MRRKDPAEYLDFLAPDDIRIKGHRHGIEHLLFEHLDGSSIEQLLERFPTLTAEEVQAVLDYYAQHREQVDAYLAAARAWSDEQRRLQELNPSPIIRLLMERRAEKLRREAEQGYVAGP